MISAIRERIKVKTRDLREKISEEDALGSALPTVTRHEVKPETGKPRPRTTHAEPRRIGEAERSATSTLRSRQDRRAKRPPTSGAAAGTPWSISRPSGR